MRIMLAGKGAKAHGDVGRGVLVLFRCSNVSSVIDDGYMMIYNDMYKPHAQTVSKTSWNTVVENSLTAELATYKEQVELYERRVRFEFTEREQKINEQLRLVISDRNFKEETLKKKLHSVKLQLSSTNNHNKLMSKEKFLATFTPQKQLTPEQIFWSQDLIKMKSEALKEQTTVSRPIKALTVYPPNTSATLVLRARCLELEDELSNLRDKTHNDNHNELVNHFSNLEVNYLNLQLKYQNLKDNFGNNPPTPDKDTPDFDSVFVNGKLQGSLQGKDNVIRQLKKKISHLQETRSDTDRTLQVRVVDSQITQLTKKVTVLQAQNDLFRAENDKIIQHYKELNNREAHLDYLRHLKESLETIRDIVKEAKVVRPLDSLFIFACRYTKHSLKLLEYAIGTYPQDSHQQDKKHALAPLIRKKQVTYAEQCDKSNSNTHKHVAKLNTQKTNVPVTPFTGVNRCTDASGSQPRSNTKKNRISPAKGVNQMQVEEQPRTNKSHLRTSNRVDFSSRPKRTTINLNSDSVCQTCNKCLISRNHDMCVVDYFQSVVAPPLFVIIVMLCAKLSKFRILSKLGKYGNPQAKSLPVLVINGDPLAVHSP
nr:hypothetical protein [Tanacetum cinerariifolium]